MYVGVYFQVYVFCLFTLLIFETYDSWVWFSSMKIQSDCFNLVLLIMFLCGFWFSIYALNFIVFWFDASMRLNDAVTSLCFKQP